MVEEIFGPILTVYIYEDTHWWEILESSILLLNML
ncbi:MAG: hypothetical protein ACMUEM_03520 [Flavobacteriales bacterium AspAUS03]